MENYVILNGTNSNTINGLLIQELPPISKPAIRTQVDEIDGRDGDIITKLGYSAYDKEMSIGLYGDYDINEVIAFFNTQGIAVFSNELDKYYRYEIINQIDFDRLIRYRTATVTMHCQPFKYSTTEEEIVLSGTVITGEGTNLNLINTEEDGAFTDLELKGDAFQQTYSGKNLVGIQDTTATFNGVTITVSNNEITLNGTCSAAGVYNFTNLKTITVNGDITLSYIKTSGSFTEQTDKDTNFNVRSNGSFVFSTGIENTDTNKTYTFNSDTNITFGIRLSVSAVYNNLKFKVQLESGSTATNYEPYVGEIPSPNPDYPQTVQTVTGNNSVLICGKNLFDKDNANIINCSVGSTGIASGSTSRTIYIPIVGGKTYTVSKNIPSSRFRIASVETTPAVGATIHNYQNRDNYDDYTLTASVNSNYLCVYLYIVGSETYTLEQVLSGLQIEEGSTATDYEAYQSQTYPISLGSLELCKIGDNEDYIYEDNGTWYKHSEISKVVLDGSSDESYMRIANNSDENYTQFNLISINNWQTMNISSELKPLYLSNNFIYYSGASAVGKTQAGFIPYGNSNPKLVFSFPTPMLTSGSEVASFKNWLSNNNTEIYYVLETPFDTEITDSTSIAQLNALHGATTYLGVTNIITSGDLPPIIYVQTYAVENPVVNVTNNGNIYSKPSITIYGQGTIELYLNGSQVFSIALGNEEYITIDVANMEATQDGVLKNRLVTGDYDNFVLQPGENEITFTGALYSMTIEDYSRWV